MNTPNRNAVAEMVLEWIGDVEALQQFSEHLYELGDWHCNGGEEDWEVDEEFWRNMKLFKEQVWDKHTAQVDVMQLWRDELDTNLYTIDWLFAIRDEHRVPYELPIIAGFFTQVANSFGYRLTNVQEDEASLIKVQALVRGRKTRWRIPCFGFGN
jgi:hypothetical protein